MSYSISEFLNSVIDDDFEVVFMKAEAECRQAERNSYGVRGAVKARQMGSTQYVDSLRAFIFFLNSGMRSGTISDWEFQLYRPICEALVHKGQFKAEVMNVFK